VVGPGGPAGVHGGQLGQPVAFQAVQQPPQPKDPLGRDRISQAVQVLGGQLLDRRRRVARLSGRPADGPVAWLADGLAELVALLVECHGCRPHPTYLWATAAARAIWVSSLAWPVAPG
jgi:hypothetical protein